MFSPVYDLATQASQISGPVCQLAFSFRVKQGLDIHGSQRMDLNNFGDLPTFHKQVRIYTSTHNYC